jgi:metal-sulfur cluster biosynthetic enzyme
VAGLIVDEVETDLDRAQPPEWKIRVELVWEPPWSTDCLSERARAFMHW